MCEAQIMREQRKMTPARMTGFLDHLRQHGLVILAAKHASPHSELGCQSAFYTERGKNPEFAAAWADAIEEADEELLRQLKRRGIDGMEEDVYGSLGGSEGTGVVGKKTVYSDKMAELYSRIVSARVRQGLTNKVELSGSVQHEGDMGLGKLSARQQDLLKQLLKDEAE